MSEPRSTLRDLEEFRRRKAMEREAAAAVSKTPSPVPAVLTQSRSTSTSSSDGAGTSRTTRQDSASQPSDVLPNSAFQKISTWLYRTVMPENLAQPAQPPGRVIEDADLDDVSDSEETDNTTASVENSGGILNYLLRSQYVWWILAWTCGFVEAIRYGWGAVYFSISVLILIWKGLSDRRKRGTPSAYSVFNPNCERIEGTLDAEQLQRQMFFRF